ncbi:hypothetical protein MMC22_009791 [Lobaria immixta]|nr:hypothetical protein [Lobaria immixta]
MADADLREFDLIVKVMIEEGYTPSILTDFLIKGLDNVRIGAARKGIFQEDLTPNPTFVQLKILETLSSLHQSKEPKQSARDGKRSRRKAETPPAAVPVSIPQAPQSEVVAQLGKNQQEMAEAPSTAISIALAPPAAASMLQGKKRKEFASEADLESEEEQMDVECLTDEFASRFNLGHESQGPSPKRLKRNLSGRKARTSRPQETTSTEELKFANDSPPSPSPSPSPSPRQPQQPQQPQQQQQQQHQQQPRETPTQLRIREAKRAKARARGEIIR